MQNVQIHAGIPMPTNKIELDKQVQILLNIQAKGGPEPYEYVMVEQIVHSLVKQIENGLISKDQVQSLLQQFHFNKTKDTIMGHIKTKPYGYAGDFEIIDKIYMNQTSSEPEFYKWDRLFLFQAAAQAVRNRKTYFQQMLCDKVNNTEGKIELLNVASGPARDLMELYQKIETEKLETTCVEMDNRAIEHASNINKPFLNQIEFIHKNIFRFKNQKQYDVVWSAGLFDYFDDKAFKMLLKKFVSWTKPGGQVVIGNFTPANPSRPVLELIGDWYLNHRDERHLIRLAREIGINRERISIGIEPEGINLFLHIKC